MPRVALRAARLQTIADAKCNGPGRHTEDHDHTSTVGTSSAIAPEPVGSASAFTTEPGSACCATATIGAPSASPRDTIAMINASSASTLNDTMIGVRSATALDHITATTGVVMTSPLEDDRASQS